MATNAARSLVVVSGPPASGKTTIGRHLADELGIPFLSRDDFKPAVYELVRDGGLDGGRAGKASREVWLTAVDAVVRAGLPVVADGVFNHRHHVDAFRAFIAARSLDCFELRLTAGVDTLLERYECRGDPPMTEDLRPSVVAAITEPISPVVLGAAGVSCDTTDIGAIDLQAIARTVHAWLHHEGDIERRC